jgi:hypothetical protein
MGATEQKKVIVYREGSNWVSNLNGVLTTLPYWVKTRKDVMEFYQDMSEYDYCTYIIDFA